MAEQQQELNYQQQPPAPTAENSTTPGAMPQVDPTTEQMANLQQDPMSNPQDMQRLQERQAFETYVQNSGDPIPSNFKDAGSWFDSLKEAQSNYTKGQQEIADLKREYSENNAQNPNYQETVPTEVPVKEDVVVEDKELRIPAPEETVQPEAPMSGVSEEDWREWGLEVAVNGDISDDTRNQIKAKTGFTDLIIDDFLAGQKAKSKEAYADAAQVVGGRQQLDNMFKWAAENLSPEEQVQVNVGLSGPAYEVTLMGLNQKYSSALKTDVKSAEPGPISGRQNVADTQTGYTEYKTKREFYADRNNPRFNTDRNFREAVEQRMMRTDFNRISS